LYFASMCTELADAIHKAVSIGVAQDDQTLSKHYASNRLAGVVDYV